MPKPLRFGYTACYSNMAAANDFFARKYALPDIIKAWHDLKHTHSALIFAMGNDSAKGHNICIRGAYLKVLKC